MTELHDNMAKLFDTFTGGALTEQGANSEILLRRLCEGLDSGFMDIIQDSRAVDLIADAIRGQ